MQHPDNLHLLRSNQKEDQISPVARSAHPLIHIIAHGKALGARRNLFHHRFNLGKERHCTFRIVQSNKIRDIDQIGARRRQNDKAPHESGLRLLSGANLREYLVSRNARTTLQPRLDRFAKGLKFAPFSIPVSNPVTQSFAHDFARRGIFAPCHRLAKHVG